MKVKIFNFLCIALVLVIIIGLAACGRNGLEGKMGFESLSKDIKKDTLKDAQVKKTTVKVWSVYSPSSMDSRTQAFITALNKAEKDLKDIKIEHEATNSDMYKIKIKTAMAANEAPDVFFSWGAGFVKPFVDAGKVLALDSYLEDGTLDRMKPENTTNFTFDEKIYGLTAYPYIAVLYCNKELFEKNGIKLPDTYKELLTAVKTFRAQGITPISIGEKDRWPGVFWQNALALRTAGASECLDALTKKHPLTSRSLSNQLLYCSS